MADIITTSKSSIEISRNAKNEVAYSVKVYAAEIGEEQAALTIAMGLLTQLDMEYGKGEFSKELAQ